MPNLNTRVALKYATLQEWEASTLQLMAGEMAIANDNGAISFKIGDGSKTFSQLPWPKASEVPEWVKGIDTFEDLVIALEETFINGNELATALESYYTKEDVNGLLEGYVTDSEMAEHVEAFQELSGVVADNATAATEAVAGEKTRAEAAEKALGEEIAAEADRAGKAEKALEEAIADEAERADAAEKAALAKAEEALTLAGQKTTMAEVEAKDYATKTEAQGYADAKDEAIAAAKAVADAAKAAIDAFLDENAVSDDVVNTLKEIQAGLEAGETSAASLLAELNKIKDGTTVVPKATDADTVDGKQAADFATAEQGAKADTALQSADLNDINAAIAAINNAETGILAQAKKYADDNEEDTTYDATNGIKLEGTTFSIDESAEWIFNCGGAN